MQEAKNTYKIRVKGLVQGVGFRPFIYRLANKLQVFGSVENDSDGVLVYVSSEPSVLNKFIQKIESEKPIASFIHHIHHEITDPKTFSSFSIKESNIQQNIDEITEISPDIAVCELCISDMQNQANRIHYPLINCTHCGPRFTIIKELPYDRASTTMQSFAMCEDCEKEYTTVLDRRFHAQPVACNACGPQYVLKDQEKTFRTIDEITQQLALAISTSKIVALKGMGGYAIIADAFNQEAIEKVRKIKKRDHKPFAVMFRNMESIKKYAFVDEIEEKALKSWQKPIVILKQKKLLPYSISNGFSTIGAILPYMPFHYLLFEKLQTNALIFTSANIYDEPIIIEDDKLQEVLAKEVDIVVSYNREIFNRADDSLLHKVGKIMQPIRRSRSYAPSSILSLFNINHMVAVGAELSNTFAVGRGKKAMLSQHIGDLKNHETLSFFEESLQRYYQLFQVKPGLIICDKHPDYLSSKYAKDSGLPLLQVQHHHAHLASCMLDNQLNEKVIALVFDGTGYGDDGNIWGGEFLIADYKSYERYTHLEYLPLPGGDKAVKEPWRIAVSALYKCYGNDLLEQEIPFIEKLDREKTAFLFQMIDKKINSPLSSSMGRLFDGVAALCGLVFTSGFSAEAPMRLEDAIEEGVEEYYPYQISGSIKTSSIIKAIVNDIKENISVGEISAKFHNTIVEFSLDICLQIRHKTALNKVVFSGGSFQNRYLSMHLCDRLESKGFDVYQHHQVPANDGGISLGQLAIAGALNGN